MLQSRLIRVTTLVAGAALALTACGGGGGGAIEDNLVRPGITGIENATAATCAADKATLETAIQEYALTNGSPPANESVLVAEGFLREESIAWDVVDGQLVSASAACGTTPPPTTATTATTVPMTAPATTIGEIVTATEPALSAADVYAEFSPDDIVAVGGEACARELAAIYAAGDRYVDATGVGPETLDDLAGYLETEITLWQYEAEADTLVPTPGSPCIRLDVLEQAATCVNAAGDIETALWGYDGDAATVSEAELVEAGLLEAESDALDVEAGVVVAVPGGACQAVDLTVDWTASCTAEVKTFLVASEAYYAQNGAYPATVAELVDAGFVRDDVFRYELAGDPPDPVAIAGSPCDGVVVDERAN